MQSPSENSTQKPAKKRVQLDHMLIDVDFFHKPTIKAFRYKFGWIVLPWLLEIYALMSRATNAQITREVALGTAIDMGLKNAQTILDYSLQEKLIETEDSYLVNSRVIRDQERLAQARTNALERQNKYKSKRCDNALPTGLPDTAPVTDTVTVTDSCNWLSNPFNWTPDEFEFVKRWVKHRIDKKKPLSDYQIELLIKDWNHDREGFANMVKHHSTNGHDNLYAENATRPGKSKPTIKPSQNVINQMASDEAVKVFLRSKGHES